MPHLRHTLMNQLLSPAPIVISVPPAVFELITLRIAVNPCRLRTRDSSLTAPGPLAQRGTSSVHPFMSAILEVKDLAYAKGDGQPVISGITFSVNEGDVVVLRGVSGSG